MENAYTVKDLQNPSTLQLVGNVMSCVEPSTSAPPLLVEEIGWGLNQLDWSDETWSYAIVRGHPIWVSGRPERREKSVNEFVVTLKSVLGLKGEVEVEPKGPDPEDRVVVRWGKSRHSIGD